jgi:Fur family peroxide stress response transcriptional regulator
MSKSEQMARLLREKSIRVTSQRMAVLEYLYHNPNHPTVRDIQRQVRKRFPFISRATIYNVIKTLVDGGLLQEIMVRQENKHFDWNVSSHHHFKCVKCGRVDDIPYSVLTAAQVARNVAGYRVSEVRVVMEGTCRGCQSKSAPFKSGQHKSA